MDKNNFIMSYSVDKTFESDKFLKIRCRVCHDEESPNKTYFTKATMEKANKESLEYIPILAHVYIDENGKPVVGSHDMHIEENKLVEGESKLIYDEAPIGMVPSLADNNCTIEEYNGLNYTFVDAYIWRDYANYAEDLVENAEQYKMSMEIDFPDDALSYDATNERYNISSYRYRGITLLNEALGTGMKDALVTTTNFSINDDIKSKMIVLMDELQKCLREYDTTNSNKKGVEKNMNLDELLEKYELTLDELDFEVDSLSDEELENALSDFACKKKKKCELEDRFNSLLEEYGVTESEVDFDYSEMSVEELEAKFEEVFACKKKKKCSENDESFVLNYELSHDDIRCAIYKLLDAYSEDGYCNCWIIEVFDNKFIYQDYAENKYYRRGYSKDGDTVSLMDNKVEVFNEWLSKEEKDALDALKENYSALEAKYNELKTFKDNYDAAELKAKKDAIFARDEYSVLADDEAFRALVSNSEKFSVEEVEAKAKAIFADYVIKTGTFSAKDDGEKKPRVLGFNFNKKEDKKSPYGNLFSK